MTYALRCPEGHTITIKGMVFYPQDIYYCKCCAKDYRGYKLERFYAEEARDPLLAEREKTHGDFAVTAAIIQALKNVMRDTPNWRLLSTTHREALEMNANKIGRILSGDPGCKEHWVDIGGYAKLGEEACE